MADQVEVHLLMDKEGFETLRVCLATESVFNYNHELQVFDGEEVKELESVVLLGWKKPGEALAKDGS